jgi:proteasome lid subunit RPN8/RPN11
MAKRTFERTLGSLGILRTRPARVCIHETVVEATDRYLRESRGEEPHEGIVYWAGMTAEGLVVVTTCLAPAAEATWGAYRTSAVANAKVIQAICDLGLQLLGQVHSHPGVSVGHSSGDDAGALMPYPGFYSLVVPFHAQKGMLPFLRCGIHRFDGRRFQRLSPEDVDRLFQVIPACLDLRHA